MPDADALDKNRLLALKHQCVSIARDMGFAELRVTDVDLEAHAERLQRWLQQGHHGEMAYMARNTDLRLHPETLVAGTCRVLVARMDYLPPDTKPLEVLERSDLAYISRYATGRDYHKVLRRRLARLAAHLTEQVQPFDHRYRAFTDSAPVLEKALAVKAGHGWVGRNSLVLNADAGSWFFLGEIFTNVPLPLDTADAEDQCGACRACISVCPTDAILPERQIDARRCISYLTIENKGAIPSRSARQWGTVSTAATTASSSAPGIGMQQTP